MKNRGSQSELSFPARRVSEIIDLPFAPLVFLRFGMACVGCPMAPHETLDEALASYNVPVNDFLKELRTAERRHIKRKGDQR